jgi:hypothetical protein
MRMNGCPLDIQSKKCLNQCFDVRKNTILDNQKDKLYDRKDGRLK